jgi:lactoylglutathione lyase
MAARAGSRLADGRQEMHVKFRSMLIAAAMAVVTAPAAMAQTGSPAPLSDAERPIRISGVGIRVSDLDTSLKFYTEVLGLKVGARVPAQGEAVEYLLGMTGDIRADTLIVIRKGEVKPGASEFGNLVLVVPNGRAMAERVVAAGGKTARPIVDGTNFVKDPDGYTIELYQRPAPKAQ